MLTAIGDDHGVVIVAPTGRGRDRRRHHGVVIVAPTGRGWIPVRASRRSRYRRRSWRRPTVAVVNLAEGPYTIRARPGASQRQITAARSGSTPRLLGQDSNLNPPVTASPSLSQWPVLAYPNGFYNLRRDHATSPQAVTKSVTKVTGSTPALPPAQRLEVAGALGLESSLSDRGAGWGEHDLQEPAASTISRSPKRRTERPALPKWTARRRQVPRVATAPTIGDPMSRSRRTIQCGRGREVHQHRRAVATAHATYWDAKVCQPACLPPIAKSPLRLLHHEPGNGRARRRRGATSRRARR